jgi:hypothetical protein
MSQAYPFVDAPAPTPSWPAPLGSAAWSYRASRVDEAVVDPNRARHRKSFTKRALRRSSESQRSGLPPDRAMMLSTEQYEESESIARRGSGRRRTWREKRTDLVEDELSGHPEEVVEVRASPSGVAKTNSTVSCRLVTRVKCKSR